MANALILRNETQRHSFTIDAHSYIINNEISLKRKTETQAIVQSLQIMQETFPTLIIQDRWAAILIQALGNEES